MNREECLAAFEDSKAVLDCPVPNQEGLTMRTFETLALHRKLITTNRHVRKYDFYCSDNIYIVDSEKDEIPFDFFCTPFNLEYEISEKYSIKNFVKELINGYE